MNLNLVRSLSSEIHVHWSKRLKRWVFLIGNEQFYLLVMTGEVSVFPSSLSHSWGPPRPGGPSVLLRWCRVCTGLVPPSDDSHQVM